MRVFDAKGDPFRILDIPDRDRNAGYIDAVFTLAGERLAGARRYRKEPDFPSGRRAVDQVIVRNDLPFVEGVATLGILSSQR